MADLAVLRTAKMAMDEGLLNPEDYDVVKKAFLRAQQIKAGLDAGFIKEEDYRQARDSFLHALDFALVASQSAAQAPQSFPVLASVPGSPSTRAAAAAPPPAPAPIAAPVPAQAVAVAPPRAPAAAPAPARTNGEAAPMPAAPRTSAGPASMPPGQVPIPLDLPTARPRMNSAAAGAASGKTSMSGICVNDQCVAIFNHIKTKSAYKWVTYKVNDAGNEVIPDQLGSADSSYDQFVAALPETNCRYAVFDYAYLNADTNQTINKLVFLHWAPEGSSTKSKMMYASTKDFLKTYLDGLGAEMQATDVHELAEGEMRERVHQAITRK